MTKASHKAAPPKKKRNRKERPVTRDADQLPPHQSLVQPWTKRPHPMTPAPNAVPWATRARLMAGR